MTPKSRADIVADSAAAGSQPGGNFLSWLQSTRQALIAGTGAEVACGDCRGCCTSSYFIHIKPEEAGTLARIPGELRFPAPGLPSGHVLLGYDENGHCPMFVNNDCSIYADRPETCRTYDCRVFAATGLDPGDDRKVIAGQSARWKFEYPGDEDQLHLAAVRLAARFLQEHADCFPAGFVPVNPTQQAVLAIKVYQVFISAVRPLPGPGREAAELARAVVAAYRKFEAGEVDR